ncbi:hypothetical protein QCD71_09745 [Sphingomonas sp. PsM26]|nr:hypothetical protein [Sphingomonas sp. PsM26]
MAVIREFEPKDLDRIATHSEVKATVSLVECDGEKFVQIDTYGSKDRAIPDKISQSVRLTKSAFEQLSQYAAKHF